jgi:uncharacterized protein YqeY
MSIRDRLDADMKKAMKSRDQGRVNCIRMLKSKLLEREVAMRAEKGADYRIEDDEAQAAISAYAKQRRDSIESFRQAGRDDLAEAERAELEVVGGYLPEQLTPEQLEALIRQAIEESGATSVKDLGAVMKLVMPKTKSLADGKAVNQLVRHLLSP